VSLAAVAVTVAVRTASVPTTGAAGTLAGLLVYGLVLRQVEFTHAERRLAGTLAERYRVVRQSALERVGQDWRPNDRPTGRRSGEPSLGRSAARRDRPTRSVARLPSRPRRCCPCRNSPRVCLVRVRLPRSVGHARAGGHGVAPHAGGYFKWRATTDADMYGVEIATGERDGDRGYG